MFDFVRKHTRIMQFLLFLLIFPSFVLFGIDGYNRFREKGEVVATVDGHDITQSEWDAAHRSEVERLRASMPGIDMKMFDTPQAKYGSLDRLVRERLLSVAADKLQLNVSDQKLASELQQNPTIASLRRPDGSLDMERYKQLAASQGMTPEMLEARIRADLSTRQVIGAVGGSSVFPAGLANITLGAYFEQREIQVAQFSASAKLATLKPTAEALEAYYQKHSTQYRSAERADVSYVVLDLAAVQKGIVLQESDLKTYYEQNLSRVAAQEERRASHILFTVAKDASDAERAKVKAKAEDVLAELKKKPALFAELAKKHSQDPGSANKGGDLDYFGRGAMVKPFEDAAFSLAKGETSGLVSSEFGFHIIRVTDVKQPKQRSFEEMRPTIEADVRRQQAQRKFAEAAEQFTNLVYEQSDSLKPAAERLKLDIRQATQVSRQAPQGAQGPLANPKVLAALFSPDAIEKKRNTEAIEIGPNQLLAARIDAFTPAKTLPLSEVKDSVASAWQREEAAALARKEGEAQLAAWKAKSEASNLGAAVVIARDQTGKLPAAVIDAALRAPTESLPGWVGVDLGRDGYAVVKVNRVLPRAAQADRARERAQLGQSLASAESIAYYNHLKERFKAEIKVAKPVEPAL
jgi:peptidyl-prolyl cis-trans isomerase D